MSESERGSQLLRANPTKQIKIQGDTDERKFLLVAGRVGGEAVPSFLPTPFSLSILVCCKNLGFEGDNTAI